MTQENPTSERPFSRASAVQSNAPVLQARRRWVFRSTALLTLAAVALCFFVAWRRDVTTIQGHLDIVSKVVAELQEQTKAFGRLPAELPHAGEERFRYYASDADRYFAAQSQEPVIIAATVPIELVLLTQGRVVIIYDRGRVSAQWLTESEYESMWADQQRAIEEFERKRKAQPIRLP